MKRNDTSPAFEVDCLRNDASPAFVPGSDTVTFHMRNITTKVVKVDAAATIVDADTLRYTWSAANTDTAAVYECEFEVTRSTGEVETYPGDRWIPFEIVEDIA